ncbi:NAD(P)H-hydrate dehydratase [Bacillus sp. BRMEA1]|uniref:NAD(P)H-hydrate dehydratase n=1 Tax=Neobacillus endophyticus TaxID=2738405 RepID=UPI0015666543|nr:NAD(P)H-hydrate dehydratase [Neobacillus endophyticus]NRD78183.1 NAD(P)H-hydrate dehydratase [Neobacillus endophyticus]
MFAAGQKEMQLMDRYTMEKLGLPGVVLMENAGAKVVDEIVKSSSRDKPKIIVLAGKGNNGGDGFVIARRLFDLGLNPVLFLLSVPEQVKGDAKVHLDVYINRGLPFVVLGEDTWEILVAELNQADIIVDAMLGTGISGAIRAPFDEVILLINKFAGKKLIVSVDIPSGVSSDTGKVESHAVKATMTVTFVFPKKGFFLNQGPQYVGDWKAVDISVPTSITSKLGLKLPGVLTTELAKAAVPARPKHGHKGTFGHALIIGGSMPYVGAPIFSAKAAIKSGAGLVTLAVPKSIYPIAAAQNPESLFLPLADENGHFTGGAVDELGPKLQQFDSVAIGPGMGRFFNGEEWMKSFLAELEEQSLVIDADALYLLRNHLDVIKEYKGKVIFTPHPGEMARILNKTVKEVEEERIEIAKSFAERYNVYLLLKGHRTIMSTPDGEVYINPHGNDALGKGGSGDVLTGVIASFLAQGATPIHSMIAASYLHARAGEEKAKVLSHYGVTPLDIIDGVREQLNLILPSV